MDGTMIDNMMVHHRAWQKQLSSLGLEISLEEVKASIHGVNTEILQRLFGDRYTEADRIQISAEKEARYRELFAQDLRLIDGLAELLEELRALSIPMGIGTAAPAENVDFVLDQLQLRDYFPVVRHAGNVQKGKPDPEIFLQVAAALGLNSNECLVFEDSITGAETALNANCPAIVVTSTHAAEEFAHFPHIRRFINDYRGTDWAYLQQEFTWSLQD